MSDYVPPELETVLRNFRSAVDDAETARLRADAHYEELRPQLIALGFQEALEQLRAQEEAEREAKRPATEEDDHFENRTFGEDAWGS